VSLLHPPPLEKSERTTKVSLSFVVTLLIGKCPFSIPQLLVLSLFDLHDLMLIQLLYSEYIGDPVSHIALKISDALKL